MLQQISAVSRKEFKILAQRPSELILILLIPLLFTWILGQVFGRAELPRVAIYVVNEDAGDKGTLALQQLSASPNLEVTTLPTRAEADRRIGAGERMAAVYFPPTFSEALLSPEGAEIQIITDPAQTEKASIVNGLVTQALAAQIANAEVAREVDRGVENFFQDNNTALEGMAQGEDRQQSLKTFVSAALKGIITTQVEQAMANPLVKIVKKAAGSEGAAARLPNLMESLVPGQALMFLFFLSQDLISSLIEERERGTFRRLMGTPVKKATVLAGKIFPYLLIAMAQISLLLWVGKIFFGISLGNQPLALLPILLCTGMVVCGFGVFIAGISKSQGQANGMTTLLVMLMAVCSGAMFPTIAIPGVMVATPHYWAIQGIQNVIARGLGFSAVLLPSIILLGMALIFFVIGVQRFKFE